MFRADAWSGRSWAGGIRPEERAEVSAGAGAEVIGPLFGRRTGGIVLPRLRELLAFTRVAVPAEGRVTVAWELPRARCFAEGADGPCRHGPVRRGPAPHHSPGRQ